MANVGEQLLQPESGWQRIDDTNINIIYDNKWSVEAVSSYYNMSSHYSNTGGSAELYFYSKKIRLISQHNTNRANSPQMEVFDENKKSLGQINTYGANISTTLDFEYEFPNKTIQHITIKNIIDGGVALIDAIDIDEDGYMIYCDSNGKLYYDMTPIMTSNTVPSPYVASASSEYDVNYAYKAFDEIRMSSGWASNTQQDYIILDFGTKTKINSLGMYSGSGNWNTCMPNEFQVYGSNDGSKYDFIKKYSISESWGVEEGKTFDFNKVSNYQYYKVDCKTTGVHVNIAELRFLLEIDTPFYLIEDGGKYKNYDDSTDALVEVVDTSVLNANALENTCIYDLNKILPLVSNDIHLISNQNAKLTVNGIKSDKELVVSNENLSITSAETIKKYIPTVTKTGNGELYTVVSNDNGTTWKTWNASSSSWEDLTNVCPLDAYKDLTSEQLTKWNTFRDEVATSGINSTDIASANFELLRSSDKGLKFAFVLKRPTYEDGIVLKDLQWLIDKVGGWIKLDENDIKIKVTTTNCEVTALQDNMQNVKVNILI